MIPWLRQLCAVLLACLVSLPVAAVEVQEGELYVGPARLTLSQLGVTLALPEGWQGGQQPGADTLRFGALDGPGLVMIIGQTDLSLEDLRLALAAPVPIDLTRVLRPTEAPTVAGRRISARYLYADGIGMARAELGPYGSAVAVVAAGPVSQANGLAEVTQRIADSVRFEQPTTRIQPAAPSDAWVERLAGKRLLYMKTQDGWSYEWTIDLCADGSFVFRSHEDGSSGSTWSANDPGTLGTWTLSGEILTLAYEGGQLTTEALTSSGAMTVRHGTTRYFLVDENKACP